MQTNLKIDSTENQKGTWPRTVIFVNLAANDGRAEKRWKKIETEVLNMLPSDTRIVCFYPGSDLSKIVQECLEKDFRGFISAGGDGSANFLLNLLLQQSCFNNSLLLGGIGLGSSNDFTKPARRWVQGIPVRLDPSLSEPVDLGRIIVHPEQADSETFYFINNASLGVTAEANWFFNHGDCFIRLMKKRMTSVAILYTAIRTILSFRNIRARLRWGNKTENLIVANVAILKSPWVSGSFRFDDPVKRMDGSFGVNVCLDMNKRELLSTLAGLFRGKFKGRPLTWSFATSELEIILEHPGALEFDGEVVRCTHARFNLLPKAIRLAGL